MFFQGTLFLAYAYAHLFSDRVGRWHLGVMLAAFLFLPGLNDFFIHSSHQEPSVSNLLITLLWNAFAPFFCLSTTSVMAQKWFAASPWLHSKSYHALYAISNAGSLLGLFVYSLAIEPWVGLDIQGVMFMALFTLWFFSGVMSFFLSNTKKVEAKVEVENDLVIPKGYELILWLWFSALPSALLLATNNVVVLEVGNIPIIWTLPLALYLLTYVLAFAGWTRPLASIRRTALHMVLAVLFFFSGGQASSEWLSLLLYLVALFWLSYGSHIILVGLRPPPEKLTQYYLAIALGGWIGGALVAVVAPIAFGAVWEYPIVLILLAASLVGWRQKETERPSLLKRAPYWVLTLLLLAVLVSKLLPPAISSASQLVVRARSPYGVYRVIEEESVVGRFRTLLSGRTRHGRQLLDGRLPPEPMSYYHKAGPLGDVFSIFENRSNHGDGGKCRLAIGAVGLGVGAIASYLGERDCLEIYEIDPLVVELARKHFDFLRGTKGKVEVHVGDGRLLLQQRLEQLPHAAFDLLFIDAFSGDAVPAHLLSEEAFRLYRKLVKVGGLLLLHLSNRYYDLAPVASRSAGVNGLESAIRRRTMGEVARLKGEPLEDPSTYLAAWLRDGVGAEIEWGSQLRSRGWRAVSGDEWRNAPPFSDRHLPLLRTVRW
ncbi:MAG: fused MFS/spermidine synthase [Sandaracinaceae bacterium]|nr:fused MFS/spermidine synthase [Sandaracinaceae bacterium]